MSTFEAPHPKIGSHTKSEHGVWAELHRFPMLKTMTSSLESLGFEELLKNPETEGTLLCLTDAAFGRAGSIEELDLHQVLASHLLTDRLDKLPENGTAHTYNGRVVKFTTERDEAGKPLRTTVQLVGGKTVACVLLQMFPSSNINFAIIGRVLV